MEPVLAIVVFEQILQNSLYIGLLLLLLGAGVGLPLPEDIPLLLAGALCRLGYGEAAYVIGIGLAGVLAGDMFYYALGRRYGKAVLDRWPFRLLVTRTHLAQLKWLFRRWGDVIIFFGRFFVGIRSVMCLTAGMSRVRAWKFVLIDGGGALVTVPLLVGLGWLFSDSIAALSQGVVAIEHIIAGVITVALIAWVVYIHIAKTRTKVLREKALAEQGEVEESDEQPDQ